MARNRARMVSGRTAMKIAGAAGVFVVGVFAGGGLSGVGGGVDVEQISSCLPITSERALDRCLDG